MWNTIKKRTKNFFRSCNITEAGILHNFVCCMLPIFSLFLVAGRLMSKMIRIDKCFGNAEDGCYCDDCINCKGKCASNYCQPIIQQCKGYAALCNDTYSVGGSRDDAVICCVKECGCYDCSSEGCSKQATRKTSYGCVLEMICCCRACYVDYEFTDAAGNEYSGNRAGKFFIQLCNMPFQVLAEFFTLNKISHLLTLVALVLTIVATNDHLEHGERDKNINLLNAASQLGFASFFIGLYSSLYKLIEAVLRNRDQAKMIGRELCDDEARRKLKRYLNNYLISQASGIKDTSTLWINVGLIILASIAECQAIYLKSFNKKEGQDDFNHLLSLLPIEAFAVLLSSFAFNMMSRVVNRANANLRTEYNKYVEEKVVELHDINVTVEDADGTTEQKCVGSSSRDQFYRFFPSDSRYPPYVTAGSQHQESHFLKLGRAPLFVPSSAEEFKLNSDFSIKIIIPPEGNHPQDELELIQGKIKGTLTNDDNHNTLTISTTQNHYLGYDAGNNNKLHRELVQQAQPPNQTPPAKKFQENRLTPHITVNKQISGHQMTVSSTIIIKHPYKHNENDRESAYIKCNFYFTLDTRRMKDSFSKNINLCFEIKNNYFIRVFKTDANGQLQVDPNGSLTYLTRVGEGTVTVTGIAYMQPISDDTCNRNEYYEPAVKKEADGHYSIRRRGAKQTVAAGESIEPIRVPGNIARMV